MNISQHSVVSLTGFVYGYYNSSGQLKEAQIIKSSLLSPTLGINRLQLFGIPKEPISASIKFFPNYSFSIETDGILTISAKDSFSVQYIPDAYPFVRVIGFNLPLNGRMFLTSLLTDDSNIR